VNLVIIKNVDRKREKADREGQKEGGVRREEKDKRT
jgi:hypothetical protein